MGEISGAEIGRFCSIAPRVVIGPFEHPSDWISSHPFQFGRSRKFEFWAKPQSSVSTSSPIKPRPVIGNDVWIGDGAVIMRGITIGNGAIIAPARWSQRCTAICDRRGRAVEGLKIQI
ncbi:hypothetical protein [Sinorhizobium psoraleae]|uniref:hypothetical protein n=1 Tax=Sinorhizobium psoraleae TaxID=520838 RepID=UPI0035E3EFD0